jgi:hypothetical protein
VTRSSSVSLRGGFDGLTAVVPHGDPDYYKARPTIAVPKTSLIGGDAMFGLHPALAPLLPFWQGGQLAAVHAVGQPNPTRSHFAAMEEMERAAAGTTVPHRLAGPACSACPAATSPGTVCPSGSPNPTRSLAGPSPDLGLDSLDGVRAARRRAGRPRRADPARPPTRALPPACEFWPGRAGRDRSPRDGRRAARVHAGVRCRLSRHRTGRRAARRGPAHQGERRHAGACVDFGDWDMH